MWIRAIARPLALVAASLGLLFAACPASAQDQDPAIATIDSLDKALLDTMKAAQDLGVKGRYDKLKPVVQRSFNLPVMTRFAVGAKWKDFSDADHDTLADAFTRLTVANYAHNFSGYGGEHFEINPNVQTRGLDKIVQTKLIRPNDTPVALNYRMRQDGGVWKVIDVYYGNISQLSIRRADLTAAAMTGGAKALAKNMNGQADKLLR
ncbi:MAG TPA: ABC transporter substrate-binding protein [Caulobacteraceae bacterium]|jgi:phospholipid transport system substrate-binding protein|nr:ABC transporter substrate-binding protein [Caulobacteraceae bacterium]